MTMENLELIAIGAGAVALGAVYMNSRKHAAPGRGDTCANAKRSQPLANAKRSQPLAKAVSSRAAAAFDETPVSAMEESGFETTMDQPETYHAPSDVALKGATRAGYELRNSGLTQKLDEELHSNGLVGGTVSRAIGTYIAQVGQTLHNSATNPKLSMCEQGLGLPANAAMDRQYQLQNQQQNGPPESDVDMNKVWGANNNAKVWDASSN